MTSKETPIIIKTEITTYSNMNEREKQIYDKAYTRGYQDRGEHEKDDKFRPFRIALAGIFFITVMYFLFKHASL